MWLGVDSGLASIKFSGSFRVFGVKRKNKINMSTDMVNPIMSFMV